MRLLPFDYAVRNLGRSRQRLIAAVVGSFLVTTLVLAAGAFVSGMERCLTLSHQPGNVILLGAGSEESLERSQIGANVAGLVKAAVPGIRRSLGVDYVSPEIHVAMPVRLKRDAPDALSAVLRGVTPAAFLVHPQVRLVEGRAPRAGSGEIMVGALAAAKLGVDDAALAVGRTIWFNDRDWSVTGRFDAAGSVMNAELWVPLSDLQIATKNYTVSAVFLTLDDGEFADVDAFCKQRLDLELVAVRERDYYAQLLGFFGPIRAIVWATAALIVAGGLLGGLNTTYAAFASRVRELATLQVLGYARRAIAVVMLEESVLMSAAGILAGAAAGVWLLDGLAVRFSMGAFGLVVDAPVLTVGIAVGLAVGVFGVIPPAWRCLRLPIQDALRSA